MLRIFKKIFKFTIILILIFGWMFSYPPGFFENLGGLRIWQKPAFPPVVQVAYSGTQTFTSTGTFNVPAGVTSVTIKMRGGGAAGSIGHTVQTARSGGGGGGGAYTACTVAVTPSTGYTVTVGAAVSSGSGNPSSFVGNDGTCTANGGTTSTTNTGGPGGIAQTVAGVVTAAYAGGAGGDGSNTAGSGGGGGGEGSGSTATGNAGSANSGTTGGAGGTGTDGGDGGRGGDGGGANVTGGTAPGGGGGGAGGNSDAIGGGARGEVTLDWNASPSLSISQPDGISDTVTVGDPYNITYTLSDAEETVTAAFYYDTDTDMAGGTACTGCGSAPEIETTCSWDTTGVTAGDYYVYGVTSDGVNPEVKDLSPGQITIQDALSITAPASVTFGSKPYSFTSQNSTGNTFGIDVDPIEATGSSAGWTINATCIDWTANALTMDYDGDGSSTGQLSINTSSATVTKVSGQDIDPVGGPKLGSTDSFSSLTTTITIGFADSGYGAGTYDFKYYDLQQFIPGAQLSGTYTTTLTLDLN